MSSLLYNTEPRIFSADLAEAIGLNEAIALQQIHYWIDINRKAKKNFYDGYHWTYNTYAEWEKQFGFWSNATIRRIIKSLENKKLLITGNYNKLVIDRTKWYRIDYGILDKIEKEFFKRQEDIPFAHFEQMDCSKRANGLLKMSKAIPETSTKTTTCSSSSEQQLLELFKSEICELKKTTTPKFLKYVSNHSYDFIIGVIEECACSKVKSYNGFDSAIKSYIERDCKTKEEVHAAAEKYRNDLKNKGKSKKSSSKKDINFRNYEQRDMTSTEKYLDLIAQGYTRQEIDAILEKAK